MLNVVAVENSQLDGAADAVVSTKSSAFGSEPFTVDVGLDRVVEEVDINVDELVAHHVHVALQANHWSVLMALSSGLADDNVASLVNLGLKVALTAKLFQILNHLLLMLRGARNFVDFCKLLEYASRFQFAITHFFLISLCCYNNNLNFQ